MKAVTAMGTFLFGFGLFTLTAPVNAQQDSCDPLLFGRWTEIGADPSTYMTYKFNADGTVQAEHSWDEYATGTLRDQVESWKPAAYKCIRRDAFMLYWKNGEKCLVLIDFLPGMMASTEWMHEGDMIRGGSNNCGHVKNIMFHRTN